MYTDDFCSIHKAAGRGGNNFRLLMQACLTRPKAIASPARLSLSTNLTLQPHGQFPDKYQPNVHVDTFPSATAYNNQKPWVWMIFFRSVWQACLSVGKILSIPTAA